MSRYVINGQWEKINNLLLLYEYDVHEYQRCPMVSDYMFLYTIILPSGPEEKTERDGSSCSDTELLSTI